MPNENLVISVCMIAYNVEPYLAKAIEGVLFQKTEFPFELVIGEDCSKDGTRRICEDYAARYPGLIRLLPSGVNLGMAGNYARTLAHCRGKYIAVCDSDDIWVDPLKLQQQVRFLEEHPDYGVVYTDVETISETGEVFNDPDHAQIRTGYAEGDVFFRLLQGNFVNNPTAVFRLALLNGHQIDADRRYYNYDHLLWLHIAAQSKVGFINAKTTQYRKHSGSATRSKTSNRHKFQYHLFNIIIGFDRHNKRPLSKPERALLFKKMLSVLYRKENTLKMKVHMLAMIPKYFPGATGLIRVFIHKIRPARILIRNRPDA